MIEGYFLKGLKDDHILVFRSNDYEDILRIIKRLGASRDQEMKALAELLELEWYERTRNDTGKTGPENKKKGRPGKRANNK